MVLQITSASITQHQNKNFFDSAQNQKKLTDLGTSTASASLDQKATF